MRGPMWTRRVMVDDYGGALDKTDTPWAEPEAFVWYQIYSEMLPDTIAGGGLVHARKVAKARLQAAVTMIVEKATNEGLPGTSSDLLEDWITIMGVARTGDDGVDRQAAEAKLGVLSGVTLEGVDAALAKALGTRFISTLRQRTGAPDVDTVNHRWPGGVPGEASFNLGDAPWYSDRCHLAARVVLGPGDKNVQSLEMDRLLFGVLDTMLPAYCQFDWYTGDGFTLDVSELDFDGL